MKFTQLLVVLLFKKSKLKFVFLLYLIATVLPSFGQLVKSKDGVPLGERKEFIEACTKGAEDELMNVNGLEIKAYKYCSCVCDNLIPTINYKVLEKAIEQSKLQELFLSDENIKIIMQCIDGNYKIKGDYQFGQSNNKELQIKLGIKSCVDEIMKDDEIREVWTKELAEEYCDCAINKLFDAGYTYKEISQIEDENSAAFNEIAVPCVSQVLKVDIQSESLNDYNIKDIEGGNYRCQVPLTDYFGKGFKVKIIIAGVSRYYLLDTGASDFMIDKETEKELLSKNALKKENYLNKKEYTLANNQTVKGQLVKVDNIVIGDYTLENVVISVVEEGSLLCGLSFFDKFKDWEIDEQNKVLILYKY